MSKNTVMILGARSDIAMAVAHRFANEGYDLQLAARNSENMHKDKLDIELRYQIKVTLHNFDALELKSHDELLDSLPILPNIAVCAVGLLGNQKINERDIETTTKIIRSNFEGPVSILSALANRFEQRGSGTLIGISSVAGERGRAANYIYGSAKSGFTTFLSGLRNRMTSKGVHIITVLPGFVDTKMTNRLDLPSKLTAKPDDVAVAIIKATKKRRDIIYIKSIWRQIMFVIKCIPEKIFKTLNL